MLRGDDLFASGLVVVTPLEIELNSVRRDRPAADHRARRPDPPRRAGAQVKVIGSRSRVVQAGRDRPPRRVRRPGGRRPDHGRRPPGERRVRDLSLARRGRPDGEIPPRPGAEGRAFGRRPRDLEPSPSASGSSSTWRGAAGWDGRHGRHDGRRIHVIGPSRRLSRTSTPAPVRRSSREGGANSTVFLPPGAYKTYETIGL